MMIWVRANSLALEKKAENEASGVPGYDVEGKLERTWSWNGWDSETFYSNQWNHEDRFELNIKKLLHDQVLFSFTIPRSLAASLCTERDYRKIYQSQPKGSYNITALLDDFPAHYVLLRDIEIMINNQKWEKFKLNANQGTLLISGLEEGRSYKVLVSIEGFKSVSCRIRTITLSGGIRNSINFIDKWDHLKYVNAELCSKSLQANSRPASSLSFMDLNKDISFSFDEGLEFTSKKSVDLSFDNIEIPESLKSGKFSEIELSEHLSRMIRREKESLKTVENKISKVKSETIKEYTSLRKSLDGINKLNSKAEGQSERYKSKCGLYEDIIKGRVLYINNNRVKRIITKISYSNIHNQI